MTAQGNALSNAPKAPPSPEGATQSTINSQPSTLNLLPPRPAGTAYHWLVPDPEMATYTDKVIRDLQRPALNAIKEWKSEFCAAFEPRDLALLESLSTAADKLWQRHLDALTRIRAATTDELPVWPAPPTTRKPTDTRSKDEAVARELLHPYSPYRRLKLAMDYWCALWFWPMEKADLLPGRDAWLMELSVLLGVTPTAPEPSLAQGQFDFLDVEVAGEPVSIQPTLDLDDPAGVVNVDHLCQKLPRLALVAALAKKRRFFHWELEFADLFARRGGFDLIAGNPPWVKVEWNEGGLLSDYEPLFAVRDLSASKIADLRSEQLKLPGRLAAYLDEYEEAAGTQNFLNALQNYPLLKGQQTNLYKCFITRAWELASAIGTTGFLHPESVYDDPNGGLLRRALYPRLRLHFQFQNGMFLFAEIAHRAKFSVNIYGTARAKTDFTSVANIFAVSTVDACFEHGGQGQVPGIKSAGDDETDDITGSGWTIAGHRDRLVPVDEAALTLFASLYDGAGTPASESKLPALHSRQLVDVLRKFAAYPRRLADVSVDYLALEMWHETNAQKDGTIRRKTHFPANPHELILSGPHFFVANPLYKTPREICTEKGHYDVLDLSTLPESY